MPGTILYKLHLVSEAIRQYWYFGSFSQFEYDLKESDKYLVEAKTLFEYQQYLLGYEALMKSNIYFAKTYPNLLQAKLEGKNISEKRKIFISASEKHVEVLKKMRVEVPIEFVWTPEKENKTKLMLYKAIDDAIAIRAKNT